MEIASENNVKAKGRGLLQGGVGVESSLDLSVNNLHAWKDLCRKMLQVSSDVWVWEKREQPGEMEMHLSCKLEIPSKEWE